MLYQPDQLFDDEKADLREEMNEVLSGLVDDPCAWAQQPNDQLGGRKPEELIGTPDEPRLRDLIRAIKYGFPT